MASRERSGLDEGESAQGRSGQEAGRWPDTGALDLEDLLDELRGRATAARESHERMAALLDAVVAVSSDLELEVVLGGIVRSACRLVGARYGALGVLGPDGEHLVEFVTHGVSEQERQRIGALPKGHGILGLLIRDPRPRRVRDIAVHPSAYGLPPHHPPMHSFLGTPVRIRDDVFGNLYMSEKQGAPEFTAEDEAMLVALAAAAGVAIENARLYDRSEVQRRWSDAVRELTQTLLETQDECRALDLMLEQVRSLTGAPFALVALADDDTGELVLHADGRPGRTLGGPHWEAVASERRPLLVDPATGPSPFDRAAEDVRRIGGLVAPGRTALVPIAPAQGDVADLGILALAWADGSEFHASDLLACLADFARHAGLAFMAARAQQDRSWIAMLEDRDRIARDMHDHVIQRLFATGLSLQSASRFAVQPTVRTRLDDAVDDLDAAIKDIRQTIYELHAVTEPRSLRGFVEELVDSYAESLGFIPRLTVEGRPGSLPQGLRADAVAVVREGLSNIARHAGASRAEVTICVADDLTITVVDDGVGTDPAAARSGLVNLGSRAAAHSGTFEVSGGPGHGTTLTWRVPVPTG